MTLTVENGTPLSRWVTPVGLSAVSGALASATSAVVVGESSPGTALAAIAAARLAARTRIVTIVDLIGDVPPLRALAEDDDPHGVSDCFEYGISPKAVTRRTHANEQMFVISGGTEPIDYERVLPSERWAALIAEYKKAGALLLFVAVARSPGLPQLIAQTEGVIAVGAVEKLLPPGVHILANATPPPRRIVARRPDDEAESSRLGRIAIVTGLAAAIALAAWLGFSARRAPRVAAATPAAPATATTAAVARPDTITTAASAQLGNPVAGPAERAPGSAEFALRASTAPSYADALRLMRDSAIRALGPTTIVPVGDSNGTLRYEIIAGAYADSADAERAIAAHGGTIVRVPLALRLADSLPTDSARAMAARLSARGIPAYALEVSKGLGAVYAGAFAAGDDAVPLIASLRRAHLSPVLVLRTGRP
jgi:SPOR domain